MCYPIELFYFTRSNACYRLASTTNHTDNFVFVSMSHIFRNKLVEPHGTKNQFSDGPALLFEPD